MAKGPIVLASDHGGFALKSALKSHLIGRGFEVLDVGTHSDESCDYPDFARAAAEAIASNEAWRGFIIDGAGIGSCMAANKVLGVRAGMAFNLATVQNAREHNDAHLLTLGAAYLSSAEVIAMADRFLSVDCTVDRHLKRVAKIDAIDTHYRTAGSTRSASPMAAQVNTAQLIEQITQVLSKNPSLLAGLLPAGGAPGQVCTTCSPCKGQCAQSGPQAIRNLIGSGGQHRVSSTLGSASIPQDLAPFIDHTLLKADATYEQIDQLCAEADRCGFASVCVNPVHVRRCAKNLAGSRAKVCTVIGFPLGATPKENKALEARRALREGAKEIDMVINIGALKSGDHKTVYDDIRTVAEVARDGNATLKVIIETALLTDAEKIVACQLAKKARAHFVKTSTGFSTSGATEADVQLMAKAVDYRLEVKASGGVRSAADAQKMIAAGATRIGASVGLKIAGCDASSSPLSSGY